MAETRRLHRLFYETGCESGLDAIEGGPLEWCDQGRRMWRVHLTDSYARLMAAGPHSDVYRRLIEARAAMNGVPIDDAEARTAEERRVLVSPSTLSDVLRAAIVEITSPFDGEPDVVYVESVAHRICVGNPAEYMEAISARLAKLFGFLDGYGRDNEGRVLPSMDDIYAQLDAMEERIERENGERGRAPVWRLDEGLLGVDFERYQR